jgi:hypothetical protein
MVALPGGGTDAAVWWSKMSGERLIVALSDGKPDSTFLKAL